jgi:predicted MPP superfamily phosphohydrolase
VKAGRYQEQQTELIGSRGLGNSLFPFRLFNHPELVVLTLNRP